MQTIHVQEQLPLAEKLKILSDAAKYDVACTSSGTGRKNPGQGMGNCVEAGICHSFSADGRCISLLKVLMSNSCCYDCSYCVNRRSNDTRRHQTHEEILHHDHLRYFDCLYSIISPPESQIPIYRTPFNRFRRGGSCARPQ